MSAALMRIRLRQMAVVLVVGLTACTSAPALPPPNPEVEAASRAFLTPFLAGDLGLAAAFADRVEVIGDLSFVGGTGRGSKLVSRQEIAAAYARLFDRLGPEGWARLVESRRPLLNIAVRDGHHADYAKAGDYVFELGRPNTQEFHEVYVFIFRKVGGRFQIVMQAADY